MEENEISKVILDAAIAVHTELGGPGLLESYYENPREIFLFFYYPSNEYIAYLMSVDELEFYDEILCDDLFEGDDPRERIMMFYLPWDQES